MAKKPKKWKPIKNKKKLKVAIDEMKTVQKKINWGVPPQYMVDPAQYKYPTQKLQSNPFRADFEKELETPEFYQLTPLKMHRFERCATRIADIYEKVMRESKDAEVARLTRLVGKLRGNTFG